MASNPHLRRAGYSEGERLVILHTDDIGMCQASVQAFRDLWAFGTITSGAVMVPCPWFPAVAEMCRQAPEIDMGVHITLNSEWDTYRWGPVSTRQPGSGLLDEAGYFHQWHQAVYDRASPEEVEAELNAQIDRALAAGIDVTHIDSHMGTVLSPLFVQSYVRASARRMLPGMLPRLDAAGIELMGVGEAERLAYGPVMQMLEDMGLPLMDGLFAMPLDEPDERRQLEIARRLLGDLPVGITHFILHPSVDTPELRAIAPDWESRVANYRVFLSDELKALLEQEDIRPVGYRPLRDALRN